MAKPHFLLEGPKGPTIVLSHGAGAPMDSPFMDAVAAGLAPLPRAAVAAHGGAAAAGAGLLFAGVRLGRGILLRVGL